MVVAHRPASSGARRRENVPIPFTTTRRDRRALDVRRSTQGASPARPGRARRHLPAHLSSTASWSARKRRRSSRCRATPVDAGRSRRHQAAPPPVRAAAAAPTASTGPRSPAASPAATRAVNPAAAYYGLYQFTLSTWHGVGGSGRPDRRVARASRPTARSCSTTAAAPASGRCAASYLFTLTRDPLTPDRPRLLGPAEVRALAAALGLRPTKQRGQNFVIDANTVRRIVRDRRRRRRRRRRSRSGPGLGSLTLACSRSAPRGRGRDRPGARRRAAARPSPTCAPGAGRPARRWSPPTRCGSTDAARAAADRAGREPALQRLRAGAAAPARAAARRCGTAGDGAGRGRRPAGRAARARGLRRARRSRPPGTPTCAGPARSAAPSSGRRPTSTPGWSPGPAGEPPADHGDPRARCSPSSTRRSPSAARRCAPRCAGWAGSAGGGRAPRCARAGVDPMARGESLAVAAVRPDRRGACRRRIRVTAAPPTVAP